ncbi:MAG: hypothetical protein LBT88_03965 [Oscillospiraceae bacterium]|jgi:hypothetical protein|nr:hypothetical protein [Oscillospiraceae bacterium]
MNTNIKRFLALLISLVLLFSLAACNNSGTKTDKPQEQGSTPDAPVSNSVSY